MVKVVQRHIAEETQIKAFKVLYAYLVNPPKSLVLAALDLPPLPDTKPVSREAARQELSKRHSECQIIDAVTGQAYEVYVDIYPGRVTSVVPLDKGLQPALHPDELSEAEFALRRDPEVVRLAREVGVEPENLYADGWSIGYDDRFEHGRRVQQCLVYARKSEHENLYAHPMDFSAVLDLSTHKVLSIDMGRFRGPTDETVDTRPPKLTAKADEAVAFSERERLAPPMRSFDYLPELTDLYKPRTDLKPLYVVQPEGVSYSLNGNEISWQKWKFHIGFHPRDGLVISTVTYNDDGEVRPLFYRMSIAEMVVPYAETMFPHPRKFAFDVGEYGTGMLANSLKIGCDCLGSISYLDGTFLGLEGQPITIEQCICIHEEDAGLAFKHTDYRAGGKAYSARNRKLVIQMLCTIANYEYVFNYNFYTDGAIECEVRLTGILNLSLKREGEAEVNPYGVEVAPSVTAQLHQHVFSLRVDSMLDGHNNTVVQSDVVPTKTGTGSAANYLGNGFRQQLTKLTRSGGYDWDADRHRTFAITNPNRKHYASKLPVSYRIHTRDYEKLATAPDSKVSQRAVFATKDLWITGHNEEQLWPAGKYVPQQRTTAEDSIGNWSADGHSVDNKDIVTWITFGITHVARPEDYPIMPVEHLSVWLKPANFFNWNPAMDLPQMQDTYSRRIQAGDDAGNAKISAPTAAANGGSGSCCSSATR